MRRSIRSSPSFGAQSPLHITGWSNKHGAWSQRKEIISRYALGAMRYAVQQLITIPDSKGKSGQYFSNGQARDFKPNNEA
jgi:hypothetical protein